MPVHNPNRTLDLVPWRELPEFPNYEMNAIGEIRRKDTQVRINPHGGLGTGFVGLRRGPVQANRSVRKLHEMVYPELHNS